MPFDKSKYPKDWNEITARIRQRAHDKCECRGECGNEHAGGRCDAPNKETIWRDGGFWYSVQVARYIRVKVVLTVAHLNHTPSDCRDENLKAYCQFCHLHYDLAHHQQNAAAARRNKKIKAGQMELA